jgi:hypothetical protein
MQEKTVIRIVNPYKSAKFVFTKHEDGKEKYSEFRAG